MKRRLQSLFRFMRRNRAMTKLLSLALSLILVFYVIPSTIYTKAAELLDGSDEPISEVDASSSSAGSVSTSQPTGVLFEDVSLREESVKHFHLEDGTYLAAQYNYPVHTLDSDGAWQDIDNALSESGSEFSNSNARIKFAKKINGSSELFALHDGNTKLTLTLIDAKKGVVGEVTNNSDAEADTKLQKMMNLEKLSASVIYRDILDGVDLEYVAYSMNVKENIIVKEKKDSYTYSFEFKLNGLTPTLTENGDIEIREDGSDEIKYLIPAPVVFDANDEHAPSTASAYTLTCENGKKYILTVTVDSAWMNDSERAFPVTVDPAVTTSSSSVIDVNIATSYPTTESSSNTEITVMSGSTHTMLIHWKTTSLPTLPESARIVEAKINLVLKTGYGVYIGAYEVETDWDASLTWEKYSNINNPKGKTLNNLVDYFQVTNADDYSWNITDLINDWYAGENYGVAFRCIPLSNTIATFYSNESIPDNRPYFSINYREIKGVESYWPTTTQNAGIAGEGVVNLTNGKLTFTIPTLTTTDNLFSFTPTLVYNSYLANKTYIRDNTKTSFDTPFLAYGFKLNLCETVATIFDNGYYMFADADGTEHAFSILPEVDGTYKDEDGLGLTLSKDESNKVYITDRDKTVKCFETVKESNYRWKLTSVTDRNGNKLIFTYTDEDRPIKISIQPYGNTEVIDLLELRYSAAGFLQMVYNPASYQAVILRYSDSYNGNTGALCSKYLRQIDYAYGNSSVTTLNWNRFLINENNHTNITVYDTAKYNYNSSGRLLSAVSVKTNTSINYTWQTDVISEISECAGSVVGNQIRLVVNDDYSEVQYRGNDEIFDTDDDIKTVYVLDSYGRAISNYSTSFDRKTVYGAVTGTYDSQEQSKNSISERVVIDDVSTNYLFNGGFDKVSGGLPIYWTCTGDVSLINATYVDQSFNKALAFTPGVSDEASISQSVALKPGKYTFSMPLYARNCLEAGASFTVTEYGTTNVIHSAYIQTENSSAGENRFFSTSFEIEGDAEYEKVTIAITFSTTAYLAVSPYLEIDSLTLVKDVGVAKYNFVESGDFENKLLGSNGTVLTVGTDCWTNQSGQPVTIVNDTTHGEILRINSNDFEERYAKQTIYTASIDEINSYNGVDISTVTNAMHTYAISGFALSEKSMDKHPFRLKVEIIYYRGANASDIVSNYYYDFISSNKNWQFISGKFTLGVEQNGEYIANYYCVKSISVFCEFSKQYNSAAYFDNIRVSYAGVNNVEKYDYYSDGLLKSYICGSSGNFYQYNSNGNVYRVANNNGEVTEYYYGSSASNQVHGIAKYNYVTTDGSGIFPSHSSNPYDEISMTVKYTTVYIRNDYGQLTEEITYSYVSNGQSNTRDKCFTHLYSYDTNATSKFFGALLSETDTLGITTRYFYDSKMGNLLASVNTSTGFGTSYAYDAAGRLVGVYPATYMSSTDGFYSVNNAESVSYTYDTQNRLSSISTARTSYTLLYDAYGNQSAVKVGDTSLATYEYAPKNGKLTQVTYGNGQVVKYVYNDLEMLSEIWYNDDTEATYIYEYTADGKVSSVTDNVTDRKTSYQYDSEGRVIHCNVYDSYNYLSELNAYIGYNTKSLVSDVQYRLIYMYDFLINGATVNYSYEYTDDGKVDVLSFYDSYTTTDISYEYDKFDRVTSTQTASTVGGATVPSRTVEYTYKDMGESTSSLVESYLNYIGETLTSGYYYEYDDNGYITKITDNNGKTIIYTYDDLGQLTSEANELLGYGYLYYYDKSGNITSKYGFALTSDGNLDLDGDPFEMPSYVYSNSAFGDRLTDYYGSITYDDLGNPLNYHNGSSYTFTWDGSRLVTTTTTDDTFAFTYNEDGLRTTKKNVSSWGGSRYIYDGTTLIAESDEYLGTIIYIYDAFGAPIGFKCSQNGSNLQSNWDLYLYEKNVLGDIVAVYNSSGTKLVSYVYNAWGDFEIHYHNGGENTSASYNRLTYRGYYYDVDLRMYYLKSRYYDPETGRFISPDNVDVLLATPTGLTDKNLYLYCDNNPVMRVDEDGEFWVELGIMAVGGVVGAVTNAITSAAMQYFVKGEVDAKSVVVAAASGFVSGAIASSPLGLGGQIIAGSIVGGLSYMADAYVTETSASLDGLLFSMAAGAIGGAIGGKGLDSDYAVSNQIYSTKVVRAYSSIYYSPVDAAHATARAVITRNQIILSEAGCSGLRFLLGSAVSNFATTLYSNQFKINFGK